MKKNCNSKLNINSLKSLNIINLHYTQCKIKCKDMVKYYFRVDRIKFIYYYKNRSNRSLND